MVEVSDDSGNVLHGDPAESLQVDPLRRVAGTGSVPFILLPSRRSDRSLPTPTPLGRHSPQRWFAREGSERGAVEVKGVLTLIMTILIASDRDLYANH